MKILYYNWTQFDNTNNEGGGVNVYQKNLIDYMLKETNNEIYFLSSGTYYDLFNKKTYIKESKNIYGDKCKTYKLINSKCLAPASAMYDDINTYLSDVEDYEALKNFINKCGGFDVIHFNNIEGLSLNCLKIKKDFPNTKVIYSLHNYFFCCPKVNLFYNDEKNCIDYQEGKLCNKCINSVVSKRKITFFYKIDRLSESLHMSGINKKIRWCAKSLLKKLKNKNLQRKTEYKFHDFNCNFKEYREKSVETINDYVDVVLAVSNRVREIAIKYGVKPEKIFTNYIGTKVAENEIGQLNIRKNKTQDFNIAYMGYFNKQKGFDFLVEALNNLPDDIAKKINFYCYAKMKDENDKINVEKIKELNRKLKSATHINGYNHNELPKIYENIDLGIVPVIWEDNLPQVAIEYVAYGVPVLCRNLGGAQELSAAKEFVFKAGDIKDFQNKIIKIIKNRKLLKKYFDEKQKLTTMDEHVKTLMKFYR